MPRNDHNIKGQGGWNFMACDICKLQWNALVTKPLNMKGIWKQPSGFLLTCTHVSEASTLNLASHDVCLFNTDSKSISRANFIHGK